MNPIRLARAFVYTVVVVLVTQFMYLMAYPLVVNTLQPLIPVDTLISQVTMNGYYVVLALNWAPYLWLGGYVIVYLLFYVLFREGGSDYEGSY